MPISRSEGFPRWSGGHGGTPVIGTDVGGIGELSEPGETGWLLSSTEDARSRGATGDTLGNLRDPSLVASYRRGNAAEERVSLGAVAEQLRASFRFSR